DPRRAADRAERGTPGRGRRGDTGLRPELSGRSARLRRPERSGEPRLQAEGKPPRIPAPGGARNRAGDHLSEKGRVDGTGKSIDPAIPEERRGEGAVGPGAEDQSGPPAAADEDRTRLLPGGPLSPPGGRRRRGRLDLPDKNRNRPDRSSPADLLGGLHLLVRLLGRG